MSGLKMHAGGQLHRMVLFVALVSVAGLFLTACGSQTAVGTPTLKWYVVPDLSGATQQVADTCSADSGGQYRIELSVMPNTADGQREQVIRRLAAGDTDIDLIDLDPPYTAELASAGWLHEFDDADRDALLQDVLTAPIEAATWEGRLVGVPYSANTQLLWYRKSVAKAAGVDPTSPDFTWDQMIAAAKQTNTRIAFTGNRYEGYMVLVNALVKSSGGEILGNVEQGRDAQIEIDSDAGRNAARILRSISDTGVGDPLNSSANEEAARAAFQSDRGGFMLNWPYVFAAAQANVEDGSLSQATLDDIAWAPYPRVSADTAAAPPLGGLNLAVSKFSRYPEQSVQALKCLVQPDNLKTWFLGFGEPLANSAVYDDPAVREKYPMADLMRASIDAAGPRPVTPYYNDVSKSIQRVWHPSSNVSPQTTPTQSAELIDDVLHDRRLL